MGLWSGCGKEIEVVVEGNEEYEILRGPQYLAQLGCEYFGMYKVFRT